MILRARAQSVLPWGIESLPPTASVEILRGKLDHVDVDVVDAGNKECCQTSLDSCCNKTHRVAHSSHISLYVKPGNIIISTLPLVVSLEWETSSFRSYTQPFTLHCLYICIWAWVGTHWFFHLPETMNTITGNFCLQREISQVSLFGQANPADPPLKQLRHGIMQYLLSGCLLSVQNLASVQSATSQLWKPAPPPLQSAAGPQGKQPWPYGHMPLPWWVWCYRDKMKRATLGHPTLLVL